MYQAKLARFLAFLLVLVFFILFFSVMFSNEKQLMEVMKKIADAYCPKVENSFSASDDDRPEKKVMFKVEEECTLGRPKYPKHEFFKSSNF